MLDRQLAKTIWIRAKSLCERCGKAICRARWEGHIHHLTYIRQGNELPEDLELVCLDCHGESHPHHTFRNKAEQKAVAKKRNKGKRKAGDWSAMERDARRALTACRKRFNYS